MRTLTDFAISQIYERLKELGDKLVDTGKWHRRRGLRMKRSHMEGKYLDRSLKS